VRIPSYRRAKASDKAKLPRPATAPTRKLAKLYRALQLYYYTALHGGTVALERFLCNPSGDGPLDSLPQPREGPVRLSTLPTTVYDGTTRHLSSGYCTKSLPIRIRPDNRRQFQRETARVVDDGIPRLSFPSHCGGCIL
jgi:hypothetical protein